MRKFYLMVLLFILPATLTSKTAKVKYIIDGDTFVTEEDEKVRMLGINATEREEWFYREAKDYLKALIEGKRVDLIADSYSPDKDQHGRLLRYVHLGAKDINKEMVLKGYTYAFLRYKIDRKAAYRAAEKEAKTNQLGLWSKVRPESSEPVLSDNENPSYLIYGIFGFILLVVLFQTWRYFK